DNDTSASWYRSTSRSGRHFCRKYLHSNGREISWDMMRGIWSSVANTAIAPMQDVLCLGSDSRMNTPATQQGNWQWRLREGDLNDDLAVRLREVTETYGRISSAGQ